MKTETAKRRKKTHKYSWNTSTKGYDDPNHWCLAGKHLVFCDDEDCDKADVECCHQCEYR